jgi:hypothetical protein
VAALSLVIAPGSLLADDPVDPLYSGALTIAPEPVTFSAEEQAEWARLVAEAEVREAQAEQARAQANAVAACEQSILAQLDGATIEYKATIKSLSVTSERTISADDNGLWHMTSHASVMFFAIDEASHFSLPDWSLAGFEHTRKGMGDRHNIAIEVDYGNNIYLAHARGETRQHEFDGRLYDQLNYQLRLQLDAACRGQEQMFRYEIAKRKGIKVYEVSVIGEETVSTEAGDFAAVKLEFADDERITTIWLAKEYAYTLVKLVYEEDGERNSMSILARPNLHPRQEQVSSSSPTAASAEDY